MKRFLALILTLALALPLFSCQSAELMTETERDTATQESAKTKEAVETDSMDTKEKETEPVETKETETEEAYAPPTNSESISHPLDGKKFIFIGNSYTYYGKCVLEKKNSNQSQSERSHDQGYFYQIAKENGADVEVTNWTYGNHCLEDTFGGSCEANRGCDGHDHTKDLTDRYLIT